MVSHCFATVYPLTLQSATVIKVKTGSRVSGEYPSWHLIIVIEYFNLFSDELDGTSYESYEEEDSRDASRFNVKLPKLVFHYLSQNIDIQKSLVSDDNVGHLVIN